MKKFLSIDASNEVVQHWRSLGYEIVFTFTSKKEVEVVRPDYAKSTIGFFLDPRLTGSW